MIYIKNVPQNESELAAQLQPGSMQLKILSKMMASTEGFYYDSTDQLFFELNLRNEIIVASRELNKSRFGFAVFRKSKCNEEYWIRNQDGGFTKRRDVSSAAAINDIFINGQKYANECATAMVIVYYKALLNLLGPEKFDRLFPDIRLMNWHVTDPNLREIGYMNQYTTYLPGDRRYFDNPDVDPATMHWQGENVIDLGDGTYYGHGIAIHDAQQIIDALNKNRRQGAEKSAYLMDAAGRPNFKRLYRLSMS